MSETILVATRKGLFTLSRAPGWKITAVDFLGDHVSMVLADPRDGMRYAALEHGHFGCKIHRSAGPGQAWEECAPPAFPPKPEGVTDTDGWGKPIPWTVVKIWALEAGGLDERGLLWCGTIPGGLFRSRDHGASWELVRSLWDDPMRQKWFGGGADLPGIHSISVEPRDPKVVRVGVSCGGVWRTLDGGETWHCHGAGMFSTYMPPEQKYDMNVQDVHRLAQCASAPDRLWVQHHNGMFRSDDAGENWHELTGVPVSNFGFVAAAHPGEADTAWFVPAISDEKRVTERRLVVTRTRDGGKTFEVLGNGLPKTHAYHIVFRHCLDVDRTGDRLVFGSTTGGLWVSEDQGDSWTTVSNDLPPVYAVRFV